MKSVLKIETVAAKMRELNGNLAAVARFFGVTRQAVHLFVKRHEVLNEAAVDCRESMKDHAESSLHRALLAGEAWAVCFYLKCQAKDRGYVERTEHTGADGEPLIPAISAADAAAGNELAGKYRRKRLSESTNGHTRNGTAH